MRRGAMSESDGVVDLRSDTVTTPTPEMRRAMADAEVGDDVYGEDPTVRRLESLAAGLLGKEAALYVPSGTMANQIALRLLARPGDGGALSARGPTSYRYEAAGRPTNSGAQLRPLPDADGTLDAVDVRRAAASPPHHLPRSSVLFVENTHMPARGRPWPVGRAGGRRRGRRAATGCRCTATARGSSTPRWPRHRADRATRPPTDTVMFCLSKGLGAPVGSMLCRPGGR